MDYKKIVLPFILLLITFSLSAQQTAINTHKLKDYYHAIELYQNKAYVAAQQQFNEIKVQFEDSSELKANCAYYAANCAIRLGQPNSDQLMQNFVNNYPTSTKRNSAFIDVANYYFKNAKYAYAAKWYSRVSPTSLPTSEEEEYNFNFGYSLFVTKNYKDAKQFFLGLLNSKKYGSQAKYYYGYMAYNQDDFDTAGKYLNEVGDDAAFKKDVSYYLADMNFKLGKFNKAIDYAKPLLEKAIRLEHSELSKIVGESYFNLEKYEEAIPYLQDYKGKRNKLTNTDYYFLGYAYYKQEEYENAISYFNKIIDGNNAVAQNAYYHLGECYLELAEKQAALNAFRNAAQMNYKPDIQKDAWLNYAKLSYEIGNPYKSVPGVLKEYMELYPTSEHQQKINDLIISAFISSKDYEGALEYLKNKNTSQENATYQKVAFYRGTELFSEGKYKDALHFFENSLTVSSDPLISAQATFWKAESNYRINNYIEAIEGFKSFLNNSSATNTTEYENIHYNLGYAYFKQKEYESATEEFKKYSNLKTDDDIRNNDSYLRIGDGYFINRNYVNAIEFYNKALNMDGVDGDYAQFQKAISFGLTGDDDAKINELNLFLENHLKSSYRDDAYYVLGNSYIKKGKDKLAQENFNNLIAHHKRSPLVSKSMLKKGLIYYNSNQNNAALATYKDVVTKFPNTAEARQAVKDSRQIYVDLGRVDEYATWVKSIDFINVSDAELDNDMYESAEKQYLLNDHKKSIESFYKYLQNFPSGIHQLKANYYIAESFYAEEDFTKATPYYTFVINQEQNEFTENSLARLGVIYLENNNWKEAIPILERIEKEASSPQNITFAQSNLMKGYYEDKKYDKAVSYAEMVLKNVKLEDRVKSDAQIIIARSAIKTGDEEKARKAYLTVESIATGELKAESLYYNAYFESKDGSYRVSNEIIQKIAADYANYKYWAAKGLIVMANNYNELDDAFQATYILESVIKNFAQFDDVVEEASAALSTIKTEQAKTNESIKN